MDENRNSSVEPAVFDVDPLPNRLHDGSTVLVATPKNPSQSAVCLHILCAQGTAKDSADVVTTTESAEETIEIYQTLKQRTGGPSIGIVDTVSKHQSLLALYDETHVVFTPSPGDLERLTVALSDLADSLPVTTGAHHLVIRSLTPILNSSSPARVSAVLDQILASRSEPGLSLFGIDYTAHDEEKMAAMAGLVDGLLWVTQPSSNRLAFDYQPTQSRHHRFARDGDSDE